MPREDRRITFDYEETYKAVYALCVQKEFRKPPQGVISAIDQNPGDPAKLVLRIENHLAHKSHDAEYGRDFMAAALMLYCRGLNIPLPKTGQKSVELAPGEVTLRIQI